MTHSYASSFRALIAVAQQARSRRQDTGTHAEKDTQNERGAPVKAHARRGGQCGGGGRERGAVARGAARSARRFRPRRLFLEAEMGWVGVVAWLLWACQRAAVGRGLFWVRGRRRSCAAVDERRAVADLQFSYSIAIKVLACTKFRHRVQTSLKGAPPLPPARRRLCLDASTRDARRAWARGICEPFARGRRQWRLRLAGHCGGWQHASIQQPANHDRRDDAHRTFA